MSVEGKILIFPKPEIASSIVTVFMSVALYKDATSKWVPFWC
jgi:hypothetical protein